MARDSQTSRSRSFRFRTSYVVVVVVVFSENPLILSFTRAYTADNISCFFSFSLLAVLWIFKAGTVMMMILTIVRTILTLSKLVFYAQSTSAVISGELF